MTNHIILDAALVGINAKSVSMRRKANVLTTFISLYLHFSLHFEKGNGISSP